MNGFTRGMIFEHRKSGAFYIVEDAYEDVWLEENPYEVLCAYPVYVAEAQEVEIDDDCNVTKRLDHWETITLTADIERKADTINQFYEL